MKDIDDGTIEVNMNTYGRHEMIEVHLFDSDARDEEALCRAESSVHSRTILQDYLERRRNELTVPTTCDPCKALAASWIEKRCRQLDADACDLRAKAERLIHRDATRYPNSIREAKAEASSLENEANELRQLADRLAEELCFKG